LIEAWVQHNAKLLAETHKQQMENLHKIDEVPEDVKSKIKELKEANDLGKMSKIDIVKEVNSFANNRIQYKERADNGHLSNFVESAKMTEGLCADYTSLKFGMLANIGFPADKIHYVGGFQSYYRDSVPLQEDLLHGVCVVKIDGKLYSLDNNMPDITEVKQDPKHLIGQQTITMQDGHTQANVVSKIEISFSFSAERDKKPTLSSVSGPTKEFVTDFLKRENPNSVEGQPGISRPSPIPE
jgi:predicted transglutaminase-like cysteine proteinase